MVFLSKKVLLVPAAASHSPVRMLMCAHLTDLLLILVTAGGKGPGL